MKKLKIVKLNTKFTVGTKVYFVQNMKMRTNLSSICTNLLVQIFLAMVFKTSLNLSL